MQPENPGIVNAGVTKKWETEELADARRMDPIGHGFLFDEEFEAYPFSNQIQPDYVMCRALFSVNCSESEKFMVVILW